MARTTGKPTHSCARVLCFWGRDGRGWRGARSGGVLVTDLPPHLVVRVKLQRVVRRVHNGTPGCSDAAALVVRTGHARTDCADSDSPI